MEKDFNLAAYKRCPNTDHRIKLMAEKLGVSQTLAVRLMVQFATLYDDQVVLMWEESKKKPLELVDSGADGR